MRATKNMYDDAFRADAVRLARRGDRSLRSVSSDLGINHWTLRDWVRKDDMLREKKKVTKAGTPGGVAPAGESADAKLARLERENARLLRDNEQLRMDREILKKAAAFFAKESE